MPEAFAVPIPITLYERWIWDDFSDKTRVNGTWSTITDLDVLFKPITVPFAVTIDRLGYVQGGGIIAGNNFNMGIYRDNGDTPAGGALVVQLGDIPIAAGLTQKKETAIADTILRAGLYWICYTDNDATADVYTGGLAGGAFETGGTLQPQWFALAGPGLVLPAICPAVVAVPLAPDMYVRVKSVP